MLTVFLLVMYMGVGEDRYPIQTNLRFYSVTECNFFAKQLAKRYGNYRATLYCMPVTVDPSKVEVF